MGYHCGQASSGLNGVPSYISDMMDGAEWFDPTKEPDAELKTELSSLLKGDDYVTHEGLMDLAHQDGIAAVHTEPVQIPDDPSEQPIIFRAVVLMTHGVFTAYGDASPSNVNGQVQSAMIRMAETRALSRALRSAVNVATTTAAEMPDSGDGVAVSVDD